MNEEKKQVNILINKVADEENMERVQKNRGWKKQLTMYGLQRKEGRKEGKKTQILIKYMIWNRKKKLLQWNLLRINKLKEKFLKKNV